jgi:IS30 family transposase
LFAQKIPQGAVKMKKRSKLKLYEYQEIYKKNDDEGWGVREIARYLGRSPSTISVALKRPVEIRVGLWENMTGYEKACHKWECAQKLASKSRRRLRLKTERIRKLVIYILGKWHWSPETIADFLTEHGLKISAKAIYNFIKAERPALTEYLKQRGKPRRQRVSHSRSHFKVGVPEKKSIHERPEIIEPGHWETDTIHSKKGSKGGILTLKELCSKRSFYFILPELNSKSANKHLLPFFQALPKHMRKTLLSDNGPEFAELYKLEKVFERKKQKFSVYYCDPYKAYQRAAVENSNGELRWYFPKKTDFARVSEKELLAAENKINGKPMKLHKRRCAKTVYRELLLAA